MTNLALPEVFNPPAGHTLELHKELMDSRRWYGLPEKSSIGSGAEPAICFDIGNRYSAMSHNDPKFKTARQIFTQLAALLDTENDKFNWERVFIRSHPNSITVASPVWLLGDRGVDEAWVRGFQTSRLIQRALNVNREVFDKKVDIWHGVLPGTTDDGYLRAYPAKIEGTLYTPQAGESYQCEAPTWVHKAIKDMAGDKQREDSLRAAREARKAVPA